MKKQRIIRFDWAMKHLLRNKANYDIVEGFLCALLNDNNIKVLNISESEGNHEDSTDKFNRVDVLVKDNKDRNIIIEIQNTKESDYLYRILYGSSKNITEGIDIGDAYKNISKVISISILYFNLGIGDDYLYYGKTEFVGLNTHEKIDKDSEKVQKLIPKEARYNSLEIYPEYYLIQVEKYQNVVENAIDEWIFWFKNEKIKEGSKSKNIEKVKEKLRVLKMNDEERKQYEYYLGRRASERDMVATTKEDGRNEGLKEGIEEGRKEGLRKGVENEKTRTAKNSILAELTNETIKIITGLSFQQIDKIREEIKTK